MKHVCFRLVFTLVAVALTAGGCAGSSEPCDKLLKRVCAAGGDDLCEQVRAQHATRGGDAEAQKKCQALLDDPVGLAQVLDGLRAASLLKVSLSGESAAAPDAAGGEAPDQPETRNQDKPEKATSPTKPKAPAGADGS